MFERVLRRGRANLELRRGEVVTGFGGTGEGKGVDNAGGDVGVGVGTVLGVTEDGIEGSVVVVSLREVELVEGLGKSGTLGDGEDECRRTLCRDWERLCSSTSAGVSHSLCKSILLSGSKGILWT